MIIIIVLILIILAIAFRAYFFRDPERHPPLDWRSFVAPSDGRVVEANNRRISIFMSIYDVHINRIPYEGKVMSIKLRKGEYSKAYDKKSDKKNEAILTTIKTTAGIYTISQIAGIIARRIINDLKVGSLVITGERMGMIRFGSRTSVTLPRSFEAEVKIGDTVKAGETVIARRMI